jgi:hypothetical protein
MNWICISTGLEWTLLELHRACTKQGKFTGLEWTLLKLHRAVTKRKKFTGLEWTLLEIHRAGMTFTGNALAEMNLLEESPGCFGFSWRFTGLEPTTQRHVPPGSFGFIY